MHENISPLRTFRSVCRRLLLPAVMLLLAVQDPAGASHPHRDFGWETLPVHTLFENHGAPMLLIDPGTGEILHGNRAAREFYGYPDLSGRNIAQINTLPPEEIHREMEYARSLKKNHFRFRHRLADGSVRDVEVYSYAAPVEGRNLLYSVVVDRTEAVADRLALDHRNYWIGGLLVAALLAQSIVLLLLARAVGHRRSAEAALERQLAFIRSLIDVIPNPVFYKDWKGRYLGCNEAYRRMKGCSEEEVLGKTVYDMEPKDLADGYRKTDEEVLVSRRAQSCEWQATDRKGARREIILNKAPFFDEKGGLSGIVGVLTDITDRKLAEEELRTTRDSLDKLIRYANAPIVVWDKDFRIIRFNRAFERMTEYSSEEVIGNHLDLLFPEESREQSLERIRGTLAGEFWEMVEIPVRRKNGEIRFALWNSANVFADDGVSLIATIAQGMDITERKLAEERLRETLANARILRKDAEAANRAKSAFLANMSHEIRTPLNDVIGFLALLAGTRLDEEQQEFVRNIDTSARLLLDIISDVLDLSKIEAEQLDLKPVPSDLRGAVDRSLAPVRASAAGKGVALLAVVEENVPETAVFDPVRLEQVLVNLLSNAVKFTERGSVELSVRFSPLSESEGDFTFSVQDTGIGISPEARSRIFEPFYQADDSSTRRYGGTGLGLPICERLLRKMGSALEVESMPGDGSRFYFTLRLECVDGTGEVDPGDRAKEPPERLAHIPPGKMKEHPVVLIVEDEKMSMKMLVLLVSKLAPSASVLRAENGGQAVALFRERRPDLIFMDLSMPGKDGFEATAEIRAQEMEETPECGRCCIVALTADALSETRGECLAAGMDDYLSKPVQRNEIWAVLERCLGGEGCGGSAPGRSPA